MPLQDLTPQLRTRLSRVERAVGWFITVAVAGLLAALGYYIYNRAEAKGWFKTKVNYCTSLNSAAGLKVGDPVKLMGFNVGEITEIIPNDPNNHFAVSINFQVRKPYYGYIWLDSKVQVTPSDFLGNRYLEILKGHKMQATVHDSPGKPVVVLNSDLVHGKFRELRDSATAAITNETFKKYHKIVTTFREYRDVARPFEVYAISSEASNKLNDVVKAQPEVYYTNLASASNFWLYPLESPALTERLETVVSGLQGALPSILNLTNELTRVLTNAGNAVTRLDATLADAQPMISNLNTITYNIRDPNGSLGTWILGNDLRDRLSTTMSTAQETLAQARTTLNNTDTNLTTLATELEKSLINLAALTSNLNSQVQTNGHLVSDLDKMIAHTDSLVQGLKHHWLLRSAFKKENKAEEQKQQQNR